jgi:PAS domain S-box-containing protein
MNVTILLHLSPNLLSLAISMWVTVHCWRHRADVGAAAYALVALCQASWTFGFIFELTSPTLAAKIFWDNVQFIGALLWLICFLAFTLDYTGRRVARPALLYGVVSLPMVATILLAFTDGLHGFVRSHIRLIPDDVFSALLYDFTPLVWISSLYGYSIYLACLIMLVARYLRAHSLYRTQVGLILVGNLIPILGTVLTLTVLDNAPDRDISPLTFAVGNLLVTWGLLHYRLFDVVPIARDLVLESLEDAVITLDVQNRVVDINPAARDVLGHSNGVLIGQPVTDVFSAWPDLLRRYAHVQHEHTEIAVEVAGECRRIELRIRPLRDRRGRSIGRVIIARDITEQKQAQDEIRKHRDRLEELVHARTAELIAANAQLRQEMAERAHLDAQFRQAQKMEAVGRLAGGVAHDFNNLLTTIIGYTDFLLQSSGTDSAAHYDLQQIMKAAEQATLVTRQLLTFSRKQVLQPEIINLNTVIEDMYPLLQRFGGENIDVAIQLWPDVGQVKADPGQLQQVLMNLVLNARDAIAGSGHIIIATENVELDEQYAQQKIDVQPGYYVRLAVRDTGSGIAPHIRHQLFEPFFTTKDRGKGTGLGLAIIHGIVTQSSGTIDIDSEPGQGTTFNIYLPRTGLVAEAPAPAITPQEVLSGAETILLVEDEALVRNFAQRVLHQSGYTMLLASQGEEALQIGKAYEGAIDLLVTDVILPMGMSGRDVAEILTRGRPTLRVLYISGYTDDVIAPLGLVDPDVNFLQKPFTRLTFLRKIRAVLDA